LVETEAPAFAMAASGPLLFSSDADLGPEQELHRTSGQFLVETLPILAGVEAYSEHLLGRAVVQYAKDHHIPALEAQEIEIYKGQGISGLVQGVRLFIGNRQLMSSVAGDMNSDTEQLSQQWQQLGRTVAFFAWDGSVRGMLAFGDQVKPGAVEMVDRLRARGIRVKLVSGDSALTTAAVAGQIGVDDFTAEALPATKVRIIEELQKAGKRVALIGDGVNDAPALAQADLGIALGTGADIAMSAAPMVLMSGSLAKVEDAFRLAVRTGTVVRQNLFWAFFYNIAGIALAITGVLTPIFAAAAMLLSSTSVVANSMRLSRKKEG